MRLPNGYGGVVNLGKKRRRPFAARITQGYTLEGKAIYKYLGYYEKRQEALQALAEYNTHPYDLDGRNMTFAEVYNLAIKKEFENASVQKVNSYKAAFKNCINIHNVKISELKSLDLQEVIDNSAVRSQSSLCNIIIVMRMVFKFALQNDYIQKDYSQFVSISNTTAKKEKNIFTDEEIQILWDNANDFFCQLTLILIYTGFRINELLNLETINVHLDENYMQGGLKTKNGKNRIVPIHSKIKPLIQNFYSENNKYLLNNNGKPYNYSTVKQFFYSKMETINIKHTFHECRHTTASLLNRYNAKDIYIKRILGHASQDLTKDVYTHIELKELIDAIELIP